MMRNAALALSLLFASTACQAQSADAGKSSPDNAPSAAASTSTPAPKIALDPDIFNGEARSCFAANANAAPADASPRARELNALMQTLAGYKEKTFHLADLTVCDGLPASLQYVLNGKDPNKLFIVDETESSAGADAAAILASQTQDYFKIPIILSYDATEYVQLVRIHLGHRMWEIAQAVETMAAKGQDDALTYLLSKEAAASESPDMAMIAQFTTLYHAKTTSGTPAGDAFVSTMTDLQKPESAFFQLFDGLIISAYMKGLVMREAMGSSEPVAFLPVPNEMIMSVHPDLTLPQVEALKALPTTVKDENLGKALQMLRDPAVTAPKAPENAPQRRQDRHLLIA